MQEATRAAEVVKTAAVQADSRHSVDRNSCADRNSWCRPELVVQTGTHVQTRTRGAKSRWRRGSDEKKVMSVSDGVTNTT